ncbi:MAG: ABC transporter ATP-binding protein/permease [Anaerolineae bacterium]|nr:ABC transporter ATP-binding protein/permease [Anaerolineae bacterium]
MGFILDGLEAEEYDRSYNDRQLVRRIVAYFRPERWRMVGVSAVILLSSVFSTLLPIYISRVIDDLDRNITDADLTTITIIVTVLGILAWAFNAIRQWYSSEAVGNVVLRLREDAFDAILARDLSFYDTYPSGKIVSRVTSDSQAFADVVMLVMNLLSQLLLIVLLIGYLFLVSIEMTLITLALAPLIIGTALAFRKVARDTVTQSRRILAEVSTHVQETVSGIGVAKTFRQENAIYDEFQDVNKQSYRINLRRGYVFNGIFPILNILAGIGTAALVYFGGLNVRDGSLSAGDWYLFIQGLALFWFPLTGIASFWSQFQLGLAAGERVFALLDAESKVVQTGNTKLDTMRGEIRFEGLYFGYKESEEQVLEDFWLTIRPGETLALVGHTGSGKTSITKLIARFYEFQQGKILIDGHDIRDLDLDTFRAHLGIVTQTPFLFDGTVMENIRYGKSSATDAEVETVARQVGGGDWIDSLPEGLQSPAGERGNNLSMGQRQLVVLARVLLQNPSILILDEATASIDPLTETLIQEGLEEVLKDRTSIVVAHRLSTIKNADRIIVLREGEIIEEGNHEALLKKGGHYAELYNTYFRHQSLEYMNIHPEDWFKSARATA